MTLQQQEEEEQQEEEATRSRKQGRVEGGGITNGGESRPTPHDLRGGTTTTTTAALHFWFENILVSWKEYVPQRAFLNALHTFRESSKCFGWVHDSQKDDHKGQGTTVAAAGAGVGSSSSSEGEEAAEDTELEQFLQREDDEAPVSRLQLDALRLQWDGLERWMHRHRSNGVALSAPLSSSSGPSSTAVVGSSSLLGVVPCSASSTSLGAVAATTTNNGKVAVKVKGEHAATGHTSSSSLPLLVDEVVVDDEDYQPTSRVVVDVAGRQGTGGGVVLRHSLPDLGDLSALERQVLAKQPRRTARQRRGGMS